MDIGCAVLFVYFVYGIAIWKIENIGNSQKKKNVFVGVHF